MFSLEVGFAGAGVVDMVGGSGQSVKLGAQKAWLSRSNARRDYK